MFEYEMHKIRSAELIRAAAHQRLVREVRQARKAAARDDGHGGQGPVSSPRNRYVHAA